MKKCHLKMDLLHPDLNDYAWKVLKNLGINYQLSTPQTMFDQMWYWNCENVPEDLPPYLEELTVDPMKAVGHGLSKEEALAIISKMDNTDPTNLFKAALAAGWEVWPTSCACGGQWAWVKPTGRGSMEMWGCICHNLPKV